MTERQQELYKIVKNAQKSSQKLIYSGQKCFHSDLKAREIFKQAKVEQYFVHSLGHGLGQEVHELPRLASNSQDVLQAGMVVTCEPGIYLPGWGGIRIEDDILVQDKASQWLSQSPDELQVVGKKK
jgi:Xaa-Pro aminopeptidase